MIIVKQRFKMQLFLVLLFLCQLKILFGLFGFFLCFTKDLYFKGY